MSAALRLARPGDSPAPPAPAPALSLDALEDLADTVETTAERHRAGLPLHLALAEAYRAGHEHGQAETAARHAILADAVLHALDRARADEVAERRAAKAGAR